MTKRNKQILEIDLLQLVLQQFGLIVYCLGPVLGAIRETGMIWSLLSRAYALLGREM